MAACRIIESVKKKKIYANPGTLRLMALKAAGDLSWIDKIRAALEQERHVPMAAVALEMDVRTLQRWIKETPVLTAGINVQKRGWVKGTPRKPHATTKKKKVP